MHSTMCKMRAQPSSGQCSNNFCPSHSSSSSSFATEPHFSLPIALSDHTAGLEGVRLAGKAAEDLLKLTVRHTYYMYIYRETVLQCMSFPILKHSGMMV